MADKLRQRYGERIHALTLVPSGGGVYELTVDGKLEFSKKNLGRFPEDEEIFKILDSR